MVTGGTAISQLSQINSVSAQAGVVTTNGLIKNSNIIGTTGTVDNSNTKELDEFEMFAQSRNTTITTESPRTTTTAQSAVAAASSATGFVNIFSVIKKKINKI